MKIRALKDRWKHTTHEKQRQREREEEFHLEEKDKLNQ